MISVRVPARRTTPQFGVVSHPLAAYLLPGADQVDLRPAADAVRWAINPLLAGATEWWLAKRWTSVTGGVRTRRLPPGRAPAWVGGLAAQ